VRHEHEHHAYGLGSNPFAPCAGAVTVRQAAEDGFSDAPLAVKLAVALELTQHMLPENAAIPD